MPDTSALSSRRVALARLSRTEAQARTTIAQRAHGLAFELGGVAWQAGLTPLVLAAPPSVPVAPAGGRMDFEWAGARFALLLPASAVEQWLSAQMQQASLPALPSELVQSVLEAALAQVLAAIQALGQGEPHLLHWSAAPPDTPEAVAASDDKLPAHAFELLLRAQDATPAIATPAIAARLHADNLGLMLLAGLLVRRTPRPGQLAADVPLRLRAELGESRATLDELRALALGDVLLLQTCFVGPQRNLWLTGDGRAGVQLALPSADPAGAADAPDAAPITPFLTVLQPWSATMSAPTSPASSDEAATSLQALPVRLSFDLGELSLTLAQVQALQPGQTLELGHPLAAGVNIRANGLLIGEGDLVEIDGQWGVAIRSLLRQGGDAAQP